MTQQLMTVADRKVVLVLEGGYMLDSLSDCSEACLRALLNEKVHHCFFKSHLYLALFLLIYFEITLPGVFPFRQVKCPTDPLHYMLPSRKVSTSQMMFLSAPKCKKDMFQI